MAELVTATTTPRYPVINDRGECTCDACTARRRDAAEAQR